MVFTNLQHENIYLLTLLIIILILGVGACNPDIQSSNPAFEILSSIRQHHHQQGKNRHTIHQITTLGHRVG